MGLPHLQHATPSTSTASQNDRHESESNRRCYRCYCAVTDDVTTANALTPRVPAVTPRVTPRLLLPLCNSARVTTLACVNRGPATFKTASAFLVQSCMVKISIVGVSAWGLSGRSAKPLPKYRAGSRLFGPPTRLQLEARFMLFGIPGHGHKQLR